MMLQTVKLKGMHQELEEIKDFRNPIVPIEKYRLLFLYCSNDFSIFFKNTNNARLWTGSHQ
jgi:hypothetical protein